MAAFLEFGPFRLDLPRRTLTRDDQVVALTPRSLDILCCLANADHHRLTKAELLNAIWPATTVDENHLHVLMSGLRKALGPSGRDCLVTVPGHGYRLVASRPAKTADPAGREQPTIVILPLKNLRAGRRLEPICCGFMEDLATALSRMRWISTILLDEASDARRRCSSASFLLAGSLRRINSVMRINLRLVDPETGAHVWSNHLDAAPDAELTEWDEVIAGVSATIEAAVLDAERRRPMSRTGAHRMCGIFLPERNGVSPARGSRPMSRERRSASGPSAPIPPSRLPAGG